MKKLQILFASLLLLALPTACGEASASPDKPIAEVKAEAQAADKAQLEKYISQYKSSIAKLEEEVKEALAKLKDISPAKLLGEEGKTAKDHAETLQKTLAGLKERLEIYMAELAKKG